MKVHEESLLNELRWMSRKKVKHHLNKIMDWRVYDSLPGDQLYEKVDLAIRARDKAFPADPPGTLSKKAIIRAHTNALKTAVIDLQKLAHIQGARKFLPFGEFEYEEVIRAADVQIIIDELVAYLEK